jgi:hypothetical protein
MDACITTYARYVAILSAARNCREARMRQSLMREAQAWLREYFRAEERELLKREEMIRR